MIEKTPATMMKKFVNIQKFTGTTEVMAAMKEMFTEVLQQVMECELDEKLGYEKAKECRTRMKNHYCKTIGTVTQKRL